MKNRQNLNAFLLTNQNNSQNAANSYEMANKCLRCK